MSHKEGVKMALFPDPFDALSSLQRAMDTFRTSGWLASGSSGSGSYPPMNVFRKGDDFYVITELPGVKKSELEVQVKGNTIRLAGTKSVNHPEKASVHRRERLAGRFDRAVTLPVEIDPDGVKAEYHDGILALFLPRAERDKPRSIQIG
jgi:HSP20 family protein